MRVPMRVVIRAAVVTAGLVLAALLGGLAWISQPIGWAPSAAPVERIDSRRLETHVRMLAETLAPRHWKRQDNLDRAAAYVGAQLAEAGARVTGQVYAVEGAGRYRNVTGSFGPEGGERVLVGAHYDAAGPLPGADDNASGVAGLLELARLLGNRQLPMRVELVAYTLEEPPFFRSEQMGSAMHAKSLKREGAVVRVMFALEMIGYFSDARDSQHYPSSAFSLYYPTEGNFISVVGKIGDGMLVRRIKKAMTGATSLPVYSINATRLIPGVDLSDHSSYWREGYPAVMITDTAFYRNSNYHTRDDTAERLDYRRMSQAVEGVFAAVVDMTR